MTARDEVREAKDQARRAFDHARKAGVGLLANKIWAETLQSVEGRNAGTRAEMYDRTRALLVLLTDRQSWLR